MLNLKKDAFTIKLRNIVKRDFGRTEKPQPIIKSYVLALLTSLALLGFCSQQTEAELVSAELAACEASQ